MRIYGKYGYSEKVNEIQCVVAVYTPYSCRRSQCSRKRGYGKNGLFCKQHAKIFAEREWDQNDKEKNS